MNNIEVKEIFQESFENMSFGHYWECPKDVTNATLENIKKVYFEKIKPKQFTFNINNNDNFNTDNILVKTYDHIIVNKIYNVVETDLDKTLETISKIFGCLSRKYENVEKAITNPYDVIDETLCDDFQTFLEALPNNDTEYYYFRKKEDAILYYATESAKQNIIQKNHKTTNVEYAVLEKFPEVFI